MSWVEWLNRRVFQWFWLRLFREVISANGVPMLDHTMGWGFILGVRPGSGWDGMPYDPPNPRYVYVWRRRGWTFGGSDA